MVLGHALSIDGERQTGQDVRTQNGMISHTTPYTRVKHAGRKTVAHTPTQPLFNIINIDDY
jgi:hypothetical protein